MRWDTLRDLHCRDVVQRDCSSVSDLMHERPAPSHASQECAPLACGGNTWKVVLLVVQSFAGSAPWRRSSSPAALVSSQMDAEVVSRGMRNCWVGSHEMNIGRPAGELS